MIHRTRLRGALTCVAALALASLAAADEGMWTYERVPRELIAARRGVTLDNAWLERAQAASVRLEGGCSATVISPRGLMITSRQCVEACLAENSRGGASLANDGFTSRSETDAKRCRRGRAQILVGTEDVTGQVMLATSGRDALEAASARERELTRLEQDCERTALAGPKGERLDCEPVALLGGGEYRLYKYRAYDDVRLIFAPERLVARYAGGDLEFPRLAFDVAFLRLYVQDRPADTSKFVPVNLAGPAEREPLFVSGHPAATERTTTLAELLTARDTVLMQALLDDSELKGRYTQFALSGAAARDHLAMPLARLERELRVEEALFAALLSEPQLAIKRAGEESLKLKVEQDPDLKLATTSAFDDITAALERSRAMADRRMLLEGAGERCQLCSYARLLVRAGTERQKPDAERRPGFRNIELPRTERELLSAAPVTIDVDILNLAFSLEHLRDRLGRGDPLVTRLIGAESAMALAERAISHTRLIDPAFRTQLWAAGAGAIVSSDDPLIAITRDVEAAAEALAASWREGVDAPLQRAGERLARARIKYADAASYADATGTLRLSSGTMIGWSGDGATVPAVTTLAQLYETAAAPTAQKLPAAWSDARYRVNGAAGLDIAIDSDIGSGCAGCGVLSATGELVGVVFDGNRPSAAGRYWFDAATSRAVALDTAAIREVLLKVYRAEELMKEIVVSR